jgi:maltooligosyltrehalose trehalohydrolase
MALAIMLLAPMPPLLFMGEEWDSARPFPFFCDFDEPLAEAVRAGRRKEFRHDYVAHAGDIPDPLAEETFHSAKLDWSARMTEKGRSRLALVRTLLAIRQTEIVPHLAGARFGGVRLEGATLSAHWQLGNGTRLSFLANLSDKVQVHSENKVGRIIFGGTLSVSLLPYTIHWSIGSA